MNLIVYGTGKCSEECTEILNKYNISIMAYVDSDITKQGKKFCYRNIIKLDEINNYTYDYILIASSYFQEISNSLLENKVCHTKKIMNYLELNKMFTLEYYKNNANEVENDKELIAALNYLEKNPINIFCDGFVEKYTADDIQVFLDEEKKLRYVIQENKKIYFKRSMSENEILSYYNELLKEQDEKSPHRYLTEQFNIKKDSVIIDVGVAEGNFTISVIDRIKKAYLFEVDEEWIEALNATFEPYKDKVEIIPTYISNQNSGINRTLDSFNFLEKIDLVKFDIEGEEEKALEGASILLEQKELKLLVCTYHKYNDALIIGNVLKEKGYSVEHSKGYMLFIYDDYFLEHPQFRRGLVRAQN